MKRQSQQELNELFLSGPTGRQLEISQARVGQLWREGRIKAAAKTSKGWPLFSREEIERFKRERTK